MQQVPSSNLLLLVTDRTCDCSIFPPVLREAEEVKYILWGSSLCGAGEGGGRVITEGLRSREVGPATLTTNTLPFPWLRGLTSDPRRP